MQPAPPRRRPATIPIVMTTGQRSGRQLGSSLVLARPGGNITGFNQSHPELSGKRLELAEGGRS